MVDRFMRGLTRGLALGFVAAVVVAIVLDLWHRIVDHRPAARCGQMIRTADVGVGAGARPRRGPDLRLAHEAAGELSRARADPHLVRLEVRSVDAAR